MVKEISDIASTFFGWIKKGEHERAKKYYSRHKRALEEYKRTRRFKNFFSSLSVDAKTQYLLYCIFEEE